VGESFDVCRQEYKIGDTTLLVCATEGVGSDLILVLVFGGLRSRP
jgi:hypothetical protein